MPSRTDVPEYQKLRSMVHEIVGRINGAFGTLTYVPIHHLDRQLSFHELCALYAVTGAGELTCCVRCARSACCTYRVLCLLNCVPVAVHSPGCA